MIDNELPPPPHPSYMGQFHGKAASCEGQLCVTINMLRYSEQLPDPSLPFFAPTHTKYAYFQLSYEAPTIKNIKKSEAINLL